MPATDPISDMLTRIRNGLTVRKAFVLVPSSKMKVSIAQILLEEGFIQGYEITSEQPQPNIRLWLKYDERRKPVVTGLKRVSKPGRRVYKGKQELPWVLSGLGIAIVSTPKGVMTDRQARRLGVGGEVLCYVW
jgi:small subunit ribosomal protein S8